MWVDLDVELGLTPPPTAFGAIWLDRTAIHSEAHLLGVYHILSMGLHYDHYVVTPFLPTLPLVNGYPAAPHPYRMITSKIRAAGVTGNIGEAVTVCLARRVLGLPIADIGHIRPVRPFAHRKAPDFALRAGQQVRTTFGIVWPAPVVYDPLWWPVEAKARSTAASVGQGKREALKQLAAYWYSIRGSQPNDVGFGIIVSLQYRSPRRVLVSLILPRNQAVLQNGIDNSTYRNFVNGFLDNSAVMDALYGC